MIERERIRRIQLFMRNVRKTDYCWFWTGGVNKGGYGITAMRRTSQLAHRACWLLLRGPIESGLQICHRCDNRRCVNPAHLYVGTALENSRDAWERGRHGPRFGLANNCAKLNWVKVDAIRADLASSHSELAREHRVSETAIRDVRSGRTWPATKRLPPDQGYD